MNGNRKAKPSKEAWRILGGEPSDFPSLANDAMRRLISNPGHARGAACQASLRKLKFILDSNGPLRYGKRAAVAGFVFGRILLVSSARSRVRRSVWAVSQEWRVPTLLTGTAAKNLFDFCRLTPKPANDIEDYHMELGSGGNVSINQLK